MHSRSSSRPTRHAPLLAAVGALAYALEGAIVLRAPQPDGHWHAAGYAVELAFALALLATIPLLPLLPVRASRTGQIAARIAQIGLGAMLADVIASVVADRNVLGPVFFLGLVGALGALILLAVLQTRTRSAGWWLAPTVLAGLLAGMALGDHGGGLILGSSWAIVAIVLRTRARAGSATAPRRHTVLSATLLLLLALATVAAGAASAAVPRLPVMRVALDGRSISGPRTVPAGAVSIVATVTGSAPDRTVSIVRLDPGVTFGEAFARVAAHRGDPDYLLGRASLLFDIQADRGVTRAAVVLAPGAYVALDSTAGNPATWPRTSFTVVASATRGALPKADATVNMIDFAYRGATTLHEADLVRYENTGFVSHMAFGIKVKDLGDARRVTASLVAGNDKAAFKLAQLEYAFAGALSPGSVQEQPVATPPGIYVLACFMASQDGSEHTRLGMVRTITVVR